MYNKIVVTPNMTPNTQVWFFNIDIDDLLKTGLVFNKKLEEITIIHSEWKQNTRTPDGIVAGPT